jgi:hypothetical protein
LPVIFSTTIVLAIYPRGKTYPTSNRAIITLFLSSTPPSVLSIARTPLAPVNNSARGFSLSLCIYPKTAKKMILN